MIVWLINLFSSKHKMVPIDDLIKSNNIVNRVNQLYWFSEFQDVMFPVLDFLEGAEPLTVSDYRDIARKNVAESNNTLQSELNKVLIENQKLKYELQTLKAAIKIVKEDV